ncbi:hypothetical protein Bca52824_051428 [Brassica carinata]|uniref:Uncharacterized protein n=1 Tax=Brassica carinata TaxID=52824 RepID=A0A8X7R071_BRACI|nr:hypothetical protein Bca52824_051428 [Brassica carinata]
MNRAKSGLIPPPLPNQNVSKAQDSSDTNGVHLTTEKEGQDHFNAEEDESRTKPELLKQQRGKDERDLDLKN